MGDSPIRDPHAIEAMEACRPQSDDLSDSGLAFLAGQLAADPDLSERFQRLQRVDAAIAAACGDVPVPEGLADRIMARLAEEGASADASASVDQRTLEAQPPQAPMAEATGRRRPVRRWLMAVGGIATVAAGLVAALWIWGPEPPALTSSQVCKLAIEFIEDDSEEPGELLRASRAPEAYPVSRDLDLSRFPEVRWRRVRDFLGRDGVAYDITAPGRPRVTLYVVECTVPDLRNLLPPPKSSYSTGNWSVFAWQTNGLLYVLVAEDGSRTYEQLLRPRTWT